MTMGTWTSEELDRVGKAHELELASLRRDGTLRKAVTVWVVRHGDDLFVRSAYGLDVAWYRGTKARHAGRVRAGGVEKDVVFASTDPALNDQIDAAYRGKYQRYGAQYLHTVLTDDARTSTIRLVPSVTNT